MQRILIQELQDGRSWVESLVSALILFLWTRRRTGRKMSMTEMLMGMLLKLVYTSAMSEFIMGDTDSRGVAIAKVIGIPFNKYQAYTHLDEEGKLKACVGDDLKYSKVKQNPINCNYLN